jgi:hypothetical protein
MGLLNYTTKIDPDTTAQEIAKCLATHGASAVLPEYDPATNYVSAISFQIKLNDQKMSFRLPCDSKPVFAILTKNAKIRPYQARYARWKSEQEMQAVRTAWLSLKTGSRRRWRW